MCPFQSDKGSLYLEGLRSDPALCVVHPQDGGDGDGQDLEGEHHRHHYCATFVCFLSVSLAGKLLVALSFDHCTYMSTFMLAS